MVIFVFNIIHQYADQELAVKVYIQLYFVFYIKIMIL